MVPTRAKRMDMLSGWEELVTTCETSKSALGSKEVAVGRWKVGNSTSRTAWSSMVVLPQCCSHSALLLPVHWTPYKPVGGYTPMYVKSSSRGFSSVEVRSWRVTLNVACFVSAGSSVE